NVTVTDVTFQNWNKNAIDAETGNGTYANGGNITLNVTGSTFTGAGATGATAQNGIVLWERGGGNGSATVGNDTFTGISCTGTNATATGVLMYGSSNGTLVVKNSSFTNVENYIGLAGGSTNDVDATQGNTFDGVSLTGATLAQLYAIEDKLSDVQDED